MKRLLAASFLVTTILIPGWQPALRAQEKPTRPALTRQDLDESVGTDWFGIYMLGKKVGYAKIVRTRFEEPPKKGFRISLEGNLTVVASGARQEVKIAETREFNLEPPYAFRRGTSLMDQRGSVKKVTVTRTEQGFEVTQSADGETKTKPLDKLDFTLADALAPTLWVQHAPKVGDQLTSQDFDFDQLKLDLQRRKVLAIKTSIAEGVKVTYREVETTSSKINLPMLERYNQQGRLLSGKMAGVVELRLESEAQAKNIELSTDLFVFGSVKIDQPLGNPRTLSGLVLEVTGKEGAALKSGPRQTISRTEAGTLLCRTGPSYANKIEATAKEIEEYLQETDAYPIHHPQVQALMKQAIGDAQTPRQKVDRLVHFVANYIQPDITTRPQRVLQLIKVRKGICSECALLFTTLARAAGIPAREVIGLVYMGDDQKAFGPHAWNEVVLDGCWVPVDASWNETEINATHISFGGGRPDDLNRLVGFVSTFGKLSFKVVEIRRKP
jgi:hypothetical protein